MRLYYGNHIQELIKNWIFWITKYGFAFFFFFFGEISNSHFKIILNPFNLIRKNQKQIYNSLHFIVSKNKFWSFVWSHHHPVIFKKQYFRSENSSINQALEAESVNFLLIRHESGVNKVAVVISETTWVERLNFPLQYSLFFETE